MDSLWNRLERLFPHYRKAVSRNGKVLHDALSAQIGRAILSKTNGQRTIVDLALREFQNEFCGDRNLRPSSNFIETVVSQIKFFLFAGHNTTAQTM